MNYLVDPFKKMLTFSGREARKPYWLFTLFWVITYVVTYTYDLSQELSAMATGQEMANMPLPIASIVVWLVFLFPNLSIAIRRLHDTGHSGWWLLIAFIPLVNLVLLVFFVQRSQDGDNTYGPSPLD